MSHFQKAAGFCNQIIKINRNVKRECLLKEAYKRCWKKFSKHGVVLQELQPIRHHQGEPDPAPQPVLAIRAVQGGRVRRPAARSTDADVPALRPLLLERGDEPAVPGQPAVRSRPGGAQHPARPRPRPPALQRVALRVRPAEGHHLARPRPADGATGHQRAPGRLRQRRRG